MNCVTCTENGIETVATRVINGRGYCEACARNKLLGVVKARDQMAAATPAPETRRVEEPKMRRDIDWKEVQRRRDAGESVCAIAKELGVANPTVYMHTKGTAGGNHSRAHREKSRVATRRTAQPNGADRYADVIADLIEKRDALTRTIELLQSL